MCRIFVPLWCSEPPKASNIIMLHEISITSKFYFHHTQSVYVLSMDEKKTLTSTPLI